MVYVAMRTPGAAWRIMRRRAGQAPPRLGAPLPPEAVYRSDALTPNLTPTAPDTGTHPSMSPSRDSDVPPYVYRVTKYNPADRDEYGHYTGPEDTLSDHGPVEAAYLATIAAFAEDSGVKDLAIRAPEISGPIHFALGGDGRRYGLAALFPPDLTGYHDGAEVPLAVALELLRAMLRDNGAWCRLEAQDAFFAHVGWDQYVYVGSSKPCGRAVASARELGLFAERLDTSPYDPAFDDEPGEQRPADDDFWDRLAWCVSTGEAAILEEGYVQNHSRWHRLTQANLDAVRARLAPLAQLTVWPDLSTDIDAVRDALPEEGLIELVWEDEAGRITSTFAEEDSYEEQTAPLADARAAAVLPLAVDEPPAVHRRPTRSRRCPESTLEDSTDAKRRPVVPDHGVAPRSGLLGRRDFDRRLRRARGHQRFRRGGDRPRALREAAVQAPGRDHRNRSGSYRRNHRRRWCANASLRRRRGKTFLASNLQQHRISLSSDRLPT